MTKSLEKLVLQILGKKMVLSCFGREQFTRQWRRVQHSEPGCIADSDPAPLPGFVILRLSIVK
ncbi:hypothetical protein, partial [uncultured Roseobacter sp.]|uniref:hypothetical protein n=1 Tax=uncultured Roseobacter sp. TaxID=114847 RepID=UPI00262146ED